MKINFKSPIALITAFIIAFVALFSLFIFVLVSVKNKDNINTDGFATFANCTELATVINQGAKPIPPIYYDRGAVGEDIAAPSLGSPGTSSSGSKTPTYSTTNNQVSGVDESDVVKTNGKNIYAIYQSTVYVFDATNPKEPSKIGSVDVPGYPVEMFLNGNKLAVLATSYGGYYPYPYSISSKVDLRTTWPLNNSQVGIFVYDVSNPKEPKQERAIKLEGSFNTARMVDNNIYLISVKGFYTFDTSAVTQDNVENYIPKVSDSAKTSGQYEKSVNCNDISAYGDTKTSFVTVTAINLNDSSLTNKVLLGDASNIYMSKNNIYLSTVVYDYGNNTVQPMMGGSSSGSSGSSTGNFIGSIDPISAPDSPTSNIVPYPNPSTPKVTTDIFKLSVSGTNVKFEASGSVPGTILNQFSMDEYYDYFRIATTTNDYSGWSDSSSNNIYVLDKDLKTVGKLENLAKGEQIYSVRYLGDRAYMVTYKTVDPLFVVNLADPKNPSVLGKLKIPGYSSYLHPYDATHIIGIGKDTTEVNSTTALNKGLKIALFDVSNVENPIAISTVTIGDRGTDSAALNDHKAFLFDKAKELLVIPINLYTVKNKTTAYDYGTLTFSGFIVFNVNLTDGLKEKGKIGDAVDTNKLNYYSYDYLPRSLYIDSYLFTFKDGVLRVNNMSDLKELKKVKVV